MASSWVFSIRAHQFGFALVLWSSLILTPGLLVGQEASEQRDAVSTFPFGWGPIQIPTPLSPFQKLRMVFFHQSPVLNPPGSVNFASTLTWANIWVPPSEKLFMDVEAWSINEFVEYTFNERISLSFLLPMIYINGGFMDGSIEIFHNIFGLGNMERTNFPKNNVRLEVVQKDGTTVPIVDSTGESLWVRAPVLSLRIRLNSLESKVPLMLKASVDFPELEKDTNVVEEEGRDWGVGISSALNFSENWAGNISIAYMQLRDSKLGKQFELRNEQTSLMLSVDYELNESFAWIVQLARESAATQATATGFDEPTTNFIFGFKWLVTDSTLFEGAFIENFAINDNSADIALHAGYGFMF